LFSKSQRCLFRGHVTIQLCSRTRTPYAGNMTGPAMLD
jgi:hypothetical protein